MDAGKDLSIRAMARGPMRGRRFAGGLNIIIVPGRGDKPAEVIAGLKFLMHSSHPAA
jgi:hypothetical protein